jgi:hypothetical protein
MKSPEQAPISVHQGRLLSSILNIAARRYRHARMSNCIKFSAC